MLYKRVSYIITILFAAVSIIAAQDIVSTELPTQKQLPMAQIYRAFQDSEGYMWYGTEGGGLCRDDGYTIEKFRSDFNSPHLLESNWITCITEDSKHRIWFGTKRGLYILDKKTYQITPLGDKDIEYWAIDALLSASTGDIWVSAGNIILRYDVNGKKTGTYPVKWNGESKSISQIYEDRSSNIWILQWKGGIFKYDPKKNNFISCPWPFIEPPTCITQSAYSDGYWISTLGKGIVYFNPEIEGREEVFTTNNELDESRRYVISIIQDTIRNYLWVITSDNLYAYEISTTNKLLPVLTTGFISPEKKILNQVVGDRNGNVWVPSYYPHTFILSSSKNQFSRYDVPVLRRASGHPASPVVFVFNEGDYWFWQRQTGMYLCNSNDDTLLPISQLSAFKDKKISPLIEKSIDSKGVFTVVDDTVVLFLGGGKGKLSEIREVAHLPYSDRIHSLHQDPYSNLWIGTSNNLYRYNLQLQQLENPVKDIGIINDIIVASDKTVLLATERQGLSCVYTDGTIKTYGDGENFSAIAEAPDGAFWAGTHQGNVYSYHPGNDNIAPISKECGLNGDAILSIEVDRSGYVWILTNQRIIIFDPVSESTNVIYNTDTSIGMNNFLSLFKTKEGVVFIGGTGGFCAFPYYDGFNNVKQDVSIKLSSIKINWNLRLAGYDEEVIILQPDEQNVELFFSTLDHLNAKNIRYAFRYSGKEEYWNYLPEGHNSIYLTGLGKGNYILEVKATNENGRWSNHSIRIQLKRLPAWYETPFAYMIYVLVSLSLLGMAVYYYLEWRKRRLANEQIKNSAKDLQELVFQLSEDILTPSPAEEVNVKALLVGMQKILRQQKEQKEKIASPASSHDNLLSVSDEKFVQKALEYIEQNMDNSDYSVEQLSKDLGMERTGLYRKLVSIIGKTPTSFIRSTRLKRAARLLEEGYTVSETADKVGFGTSSYLSKCFQEEFGVRPSEYIASFKKRKNIPDS